MEYHAFCDWLNCLTWCLRGEVINKGVLDSTVDLGQLTTAPDETNVHDEPMYPESLYEVSSSQGQDQDDFLEDFSYFSVPALMTGLDEDEMDNISIQTNICKEDTFTDDMYTGNMEEQEMRKSQKRKQPELCCMDEIDIEEQCDKVYVTDGHDTFQNNSVIEYPNNQFPSN
ncbi:hypothetical protein ACJMK2_041142 [Sinanodonta woodiana]|uniref:Uncharacterized protein n=1 Tax=Sinanodonta woodiana TaxID=1069815 RepID=A0ABD3W365_SINWO